MNKNRRGDMTPFAMGERPKRQNPVLLPVMWGASLGMTLGNRVRITKKTGGLRPPYLVLAQHQGFTDYALAPRALFPHRASYVSDMEGFANYGRLLYGWLGAIPTRRFVSDVRLVKNIRHALFEQGQIVVLFPEARHSVCGVCSPLPPSTGKLVKHLGVPVVTLTTHGSYLNCPVWDESHTRKAPIEVTVEKLLAPDEIAARSAAEINALIGERFAYDEYRWQAEKRVAIEYPRRAEGLHKVLYQCPACLAEHAMVSHGHSLGCTACGKEWRMDEYGRLAAAGGAGKTEYPHIPDWYAFEREQVRAQLERGEYRLDSEVDIQALPSHRGFVPLGKGRLIHTPEGFTLYMGTGAKEQAGGGKAGESLHFPTAGLFSVQTEYDYHHGEGDCLVLNTRDCCYYLYPRGEGFSVTKVQLAAEVLHGTK